MGDRKLFAPPHLFGSMGTEVLGNAKNTHLHIRAQYYQTLYQNIHLLPALSFSKSIRTGLGIRSLSPFPELGYTYGRFSARPPLCRTCFVKCGHVHIVCVCVCVCVYTPGQHCHGQRCNIGAGTPGASSTPYHRNQSGMLVSTSSDAVVWK